jgi:hypothetical protein
MTELVRALVAAGPRLNERVLKEMYADPFWEARFGARGRAHARADGDFHIRYIVAALESNDPGSFATYARWLRDLLVARGMCTRHIGETFDRLAAAIVDEGLPDGDRAAEIVREGARGLVHTIGDAALIDRGRARWARDVATQVSGERVAADAEHVLSFAADALVSGSTSHLAMYLEFLARSGHAAGGPLHDAILALPEMPASAKALVTEAWSWTRNSR